MKVSELLEDLNNRPQDAQLLVIDPNDSPSRPNIFTIESVLKEGKETTVILIGKSTRNPLETLPGILLQAPHKVYKASMFKSNEGDGKYQVSVDGVILQSGLETEKEAKLFVRGFVLGFQTGMSEKGLNAAEDTSG